MPLSQPPNCTDPVLTHFSLAGKIAAVTGGAREIGLEVVRALAEAGADVALIYNTNKEADTTAAEIAKAAGVRVQAFDCDVSNRDSAVEYIKELTETFGRGRLDVVVANAGVCANVTSLEYTKENWNFSNSVNLDGVMWTAQAAGRIFKKQGCGNLIITASVSATLVNVPQTQAAYNASKAAVVHLGKSLTVEWTEFARVNCVSPGFVQTDIIAVQGEDIKTKWMSMVPARRVAHPAELKGVYVFLASDASSYMTGADVIIDGGYTLT